MIGVSSNAELDTSSNIIIPNTLSTFTNGSYVLLGTSRIAQHHKGYLFKSEQNGEININFT